MVKISFIASGIILGLATISSASASIISRSFLDQALTDYATNTALDLKADKADLTDLSDKIGDAWPYGSDMGGGLYNLSWQLYPPEINLENASDLVRFLFGGEIESGINQGGVLNILGESVFYTGAYDINTGQIDDGFRSLLQLTDGWTDSKKKTHLGVKGLNDKIGTLPSGNFREFPGYDLLFPYLNQPYTYPTSLAELITAIYGNSETGETGLLEGIIAGFGIDTDGDGQFDSNIGTLSNFGLAKNAIDLANATTAKIGDLPTEYATVGAALTAMKSDIDAKNLPSTSDDGQYVLSAKKVGDTITYTWVKMDLTNEEQAQ